MSGRVAAVTVIDLNLRLLDRQVVDRDDRLICKIDDVEVERGEDGALYAARILVGPRALGRRLGGRPGVWMRSIAERLARKPMPSIDFALVDDIGFKIKISASRDDLDVASLEDWVRDHFISRVPGSRHASE
jgi:hypothetical protein